MDTKAPGWKMLDGMLLAAMIILCCVLIADALALAYAY
jgi:hypothetical protein